MRVESKTLLVVLLGGRAVFTNSKPEPGELDKLLEKTLKLTRELPLIERTDVSKEQLEEINRKAKKDELYRRLPQLEELREEIDEASKKLASITTDLENSDYGNICKDLVWKIENKLGQNFVDIKFEHEEQA